MRSRLCRLEVLLLISVMMLSFLIACTSSPAAETSLPANMESFPLETIDQDARNIRIEKIPEKIISLAPSNTEILYALHLKDQLVGVTEYCNYPEAAREKPKVGGYSTIDIEKVTEIQPDLILATNIHKKEVTPKLESLGFTVLTIDPKSIDEVLEAFTLLGLCTGKKDEAAYLVTDMQNRIKAVTDKTSALTEAQKPRVFYVLWYDPLATVASGTRVHDLIVKAGGKNIAGDLSGYADISLEAVISMNPQVIIADVGHGSREDMNYQYVLTEKRFKDIEALRNNRVHGIDSDIVSRPGPRIIEGLESFAQLIHPELFP